MISFNSKIRIYEDRREAGRELASHLQKYKKNAVVLCIPNGGVPVAEEISRMLEINFDLLIVRKLKIPYNQEAGFGAVTIDRAIVLNEELLPYLHMKREEIDHQVDETIENIKQRIHLYKGKNKFVEINEKNVILVDDGLASGYTMISAIRSIKKQDPRKIIVAVPTASSSAVEKIKPLVAELYCPNVRGTPFAVASAYRNWYDLEDQEVLNILKTSKYFRDNVQS